MTHGGVYSLYRRFKTGEDGFHRLMRRRVRNVLLVSTFYDAFIFEQDGRLSEQIWGEYQQLNLSTAPRVVSEPTGAQALERLEQEPFDLVVTMMRIGEVGPFELAERVKARHPDMPVLLLLNVDSDLPEAERRMPDSVIDDVFLWNGDTKLFLAMLKQVEDRMNVDEDTHRSMVRVVLVVEDSVRFYSRFLPMLYEQIMQQTQRLISQELSDIHKRLRMRARPKVLLAHTLDQALEWIDRYSDYLVGVLSDVSYPFHGEMREFAGLELLQRLRELPYDVPAVLQSSDEDNREKAEALQARFLWKHSHAMMHDLRNIMRGDWGYGDFIFRSESGEKFAAARDLAEFQRVLQAIPAESLLFHGSGNHFSSWLIAHGDIALAREMRPLRIGDFSDAEGVRRYLLGAFHRVWRQQTLGCIINYDPGRLTGRGHVMRLAEGTLGGKARGLAFLNAILSVAGLERRYPALRVSVPATAVIGAAEYDSFMSGVDTSASDVLEQLAAQNLTNTLRKRLLVLAELSDGPLAVRSSGLLEDSYAHSFAGVYHTTLLPQTGTAEERFMALEAAVKEVYASLWRPHAVKNLRSVGCSPDDEKMSVMAQELSGEARDGLFAPEWSGRLRWDEASQGGDCTLIEGLGAGFDALPPTEPVAPPDDWPPELALVQARPIAPLALDLASADDLVEAPGREDWSVIDGELGQALAHVAALMSEAMLSPVEIEFAIPGPGRLDLLQVRPITKIDFEQHTTE